MKHEHGYVVLENGAIMETSNNSAMKKLNVSEVVVQRKKKIRRITIHYSKKSNMFMEFYFANTLGVNFLQPWVPGWGGSRAGL